MPSSPTSPPTSPLPSTLSTPPPSNPFYLTHFPTPQVLLVIFNRPKALNCINTASHWALHELFAWYDNEPSLRCAVVTGMGRAFCAGADLKEWNQSNEKGPSDRTGRMPPSGFGGLSKRSGKKPTLLALNGLAYGGGCEMLINSDLIYASARSALLALPEVQRGVTATAGALPRLIRTVGRPRAMELALTGRTLSAAEAREWGLVNEAVEGGNVEEDAAENVAGVLRRGCVRRAVEVAGTIAANSPDSVIVTREGIKMGWEGVGVHEATRLVDETWGERLSRGENIREGLRAFVEKRRPRWRDSKL